MSLDWDLSVILWDRVFQGIAFSRRGSQLKHRWSHLRISRDVQHHHRPADAASGYLVPRKLVGWWRYDKVLQIMRAVGLLSV